MPPVPRDVLRRSAAVGAAAGAAAVSLRALARPLEAGDTRLLDWEAVRRHAFARTGETGAVGLPDAPALRAAYGAMAAEMAPLMGEVVQSPVDGYPPFDVLDRRGFIDANLAMVQRLFEPVERLRATLPASRGGALGRSVLSRYVGELFGFLSRRVLGQYDPVLLLAPVADKPPSALTLVEPNVRGFERRQGLPGESLRRWLVLHELTHAWQFESHPWLREHLAGLMRELLAEELVAGLADTASDGASAPGAARRRQRPSSVALLRSLGPTLRTQLRAVGRLQAVMSVTEGYGNFVMHRVGERHIPDFERLERGFHDRASHRSLLEQLVLAVTGMRMKMRQYEQGERFAVAVSERGGLALLNRVWDGPEAMPTMAELREPERWVSRVGG